MSAPFIYISTHPIKEGKLEDTRAWNREFMELVEANEPRVIAAHMYINEGQTKVTIIQIHPDAASMDFHLQVARDQIDEGFRLADTAGIQVYGTPGAVLQEALRQNAKLGVPVSIKAHHVGGFDRRAPGSDSRVSTHAEGLRRQGPARSAGAS